MSSLPSVSRAQRAAKKWFEVAGDKISAHPYE